MPGDTNCHDSLVEPAQRSLSAGTPVAEIRGYPTGAIRFVQPEEGGVDYFSTYHGSHGPSRSTAARRSRTKGAAGEALHRRPPRLYRMRHRASMARYQRKEFDEFTLSTKVNGAWLVIKEVQVTKLVDVCTT